MPCVALLHRATTCMHRPCVGYAIARKTPVCLIFKKSVLMSGISAVLLVPWSGWDHSCALFPSRRYQGCSSLTMHRFFPLLRTCGVGGSIFLVLHAFAFVLCGVWVFEGWAVEQRRGTCSAAHQTGVRQGDPTPGKKMPCVVFACL